MWYCFVFGYASVDITEIVIDNFILHVICFFL